MMLSAVLISGCTAQNPNAGQPVINPTTGATTGYEPAVIVDTNGIEKVGTKVDQVLSTLSTLNTASAGINPYAAPVQVGIDVAKTVEVAIPSVLFALSSVVAWFQNRGKKIQAAAAAQLAKSPTNEHAIANAPSQAVAAAIAQHSADAQEVVPKPS